MLELTNLFETDTVRITLNNAAKNIYEFKAQSVATKIALVDKLQVGNWNI